MNQFPSDSPFYEERKRPLDWEQLQLFPTHHLEVEASKDVDSAEMAAKRAYDLIDEAYAELFDIPKVSNPHVDQAIDRAMHLLRGAQDQL